MSKYITQSQKEKQCYIQTEFYNFQLDSNLASWNSEIKSLQNSMKLEEVEMKFKDGTTKKIWKVNRPKPEATETVDFVSNFNILRYK